MCRNFRGYKSQFRHCKTIVCSALRKETAKDIILLKEPFPDIHKKVLFKNFLKFTGKHLYRSLYLIKLLASSLQPE